MPKIDLNSDLGEGAGDDLDALILDLVTSANIACGGHAGDEKTMRTAIGAAVMRGVRIGAHPSYPDRENFGRVSIAMSSAKIVDSILEQTELLMKIAETERAHVAYIKPHGALYNDAAADIEIGRAVFSAAERLSLPVMAVAGSALAANEPVRVISEGFIDRGYSAEGMLIPRSQPGALITNPKIGAAQALELAPNVDSLCVHSDTPGALELLKAARSALEEAGYEITSVT